MAAICFLSLLLLFSSQQHAVGAAAIPPKLHDNATDRASLLAFKSAISDDPHGSLAQWNTTVRFCLWRGVACGGGLPERVVALRLPSLGLAGTISPALANLTFLRTLNLSSNRLRGHIPRDLARLSRLQDLDLARNSLDGTVPSELSRCALLGTMALSYNMLGGPIPSEFGSLRSLRHLDVRNNSVTGHIPPSLSNISLLARLDLSNNQLSGLIPSSLGKLSRLEYLDLGFNHLHGDVAATTLWNLTSLKYLFLDLNSLSGSLPPNLGLALPNLTFLSIPYNDLSGEIPASLPNASRLFAIQLLGNDLSGVVPRNLGSLRNLLWLSLSFNRLEAEEPDDWSFLAALSNCTFLEELQLAYNHLGGTLPRSIANLSTALEFINIGNNYIRGRIPPEIGNLVNLTYLDMGPNLLVGSVPASLGLLRNLHILDLTTNNLSGAIPLTLGNLSQLNLIFLDGNSFSGSIPASLGNCKFLELLNFAHNKLTGTIPKEVLSITALSRELSLEENMLTGSIPSEVGSLTNLGILLLSGNGLSGEIPSSLGKCQVLEFLSLDRNFFRGRIPASLSALRGLQELNLSQNNLSGELPEFLKDLPRLYYLGLSLNDFEGEVPTTGVFANSTAVAVHGDDKLCGGNPVLHLPACSPKAPKKKHNSRTLVLIISISIVFIFLLLLVMLLVASRYLLKKRRRKSLADHTAMAQIMRVPYAELARATDGFSEANIIGSGSFGTVYKGVLDDEHGNKVVAVKVFDLHQLGALKSFSAECEAFRNVRHRNLIKILSACSSVDFNGNDFKAMVFEFMSNGSLERWLHNSEADECDFGPKNLNLAQRLNLAIDVASALEYLHHHGQTPIVHCDLKPSNILLDDDMTGIVCDFGLARFMEESAQSSNVSLGMKGTIGYIAPEYGMANKVSTHGDVYSYGILVLELFTGKRPTEEDAFEEGGNLRTFVEMALPERVVDVIDVRLLTEGETKCSNGDDATTIYDATFLDCVSSVLGIGLLCTKDLPMERIDMKTITDELHVIRSVFFDD
ncbi:receptor kinase-like protein Xa21 [Iris pallida]|uniref:Receptor kinase-like protein Xa21 n=1 Tax=Iris pallida TaxID=29817 RepID=A0AAX6G0S3_IRIPA|nr:receptor kinase-like protein Xa21 [Iris pallida]